MTRPQYMNAKQKQALTMFLAAAQFLEDAVKSANGVPVKALADLKRARTFSWNGSTAWLKALDEKTQRSILNMIKDVNIGIITSRQAKEWQEMTDKFIGGQEYVERYVEIVLESRCKGCDGSPGSECPIRESNRHFNVPAWDESHPVCEYVGSGSVE